MANIFGAGVSAADKRALRARYDDTSLKMLGLMLNLEKAL